MSREAQAQVTLDATAPAECPLEEGLRAQVAELSGRTFEQQNIEGVVRVAVEAPTSPEKEWRLTLVLHHEGTASSRVLTAPDCESLTSAAATSLALLLEPVSPPKKEEPPSAPSSPGATAARPEERDETAAEKKKEKVTKWIPGLGVRGGVDTASLPEVTPMAELVGALVHGDARIEAGALLIPSREYFDAGGKASLGITAGFLRLCSGKSGELWAYLVCAQGELGELEVASVGVEPPVTSGALWAAGGVEFRGMYRPTRGLRLNVSVPFILPATRHKLELNGGEIVHEVPSLDIRFLGGIESTWE